jgi:cystathionine gamma-synthase/methionine-gamma-lyase
MGKRVPGVSLIDIHTRAVQLPSLDWPQNSVVPPIYQTAAYVYHSVNAVDEIFTGESTGYTYTRGGNPTTQLLADLLAGLENADAAVIAASGMGAILAAILTLAPKPSPIYLAQEIYGGSRGLVRRVLEPLGYPWQWVDTHNSADIDQLSHLAPGVLLVETISNPLGRVCALDEVIAAAHHGGTRVLVDNTFATPYHALPLNWGADLVVHSVTKFIGGHSDVILGAVAGARDLIERAASIINVSGITPDPFASWLALRGARSFALRMERSSENALALATLLKGHPHAEVVHYPGLSVHPDYETARRLLTRGFGAIIGLSVKGGQAGAETLVNTLRLVPFVPSLGDVMTTVSHPVAASHRELSVEEQQRVGIHPGVLRISVGIENVRDLIEDFSTALDALSE